MQTRCTKQREHATTPAMCVLTYKYNEHSPTE